MSSLINITIPVFNEEKMLAGTIEKLAGFVNSHLRDRCEIVIANNGSTDRTLEIAHQLQGVYPHVRVLDVIEKGRGGALKRAWAESQADILTYMDCDLSTDLACFMPLIEPLLAGAHQISIGSRLLSFSRTTRGLKRSLISKSYNILVHTLFNPQFSDAQCGFKAITKKAFTELHPLIEDNGWFMDTELLLVAEQLGYQIFDLPVRWTDDPDSKVKIFRTAFEDLKGLWRLKRKFASRNFSPRHDFIASAPHGRH
jgi:glycosyltransferase involved in cell wall biosynthesis